MASSGRVYQWAQSDGWRRLCSTPSATRSNHSRESRPRRTVAPDSRNCSRAADSTSGFSHPDAGSAASNGRRLNDTMRFEVDTTWTRVGTDGRVVLAGSPLRIFRLTRAGADVATRIEAGSDVATSRLTDRLLDAGAVHPIPERGSFGVEDLTVVTPQLGGVVADDPRITVDDGSEPPLPGATIRLERNRGPAAARNAGRSLVTTDFIAFVDADVDCPAVGPHGTPDAQWWERLLGHFEDPAVALVAPRIVGDEGSSLDLGAEPARIRSGTRVSYVPAATIVVRAAAFDDVGGFDERLRFGEDVDFVWRLDQAGWRCRYEPGVTVAHRPRSTWGQRLRQQVGYGSASAPLGLRHPGALAPYRSNLWTIAVWLLVLLGRPVTGTAVAAASAVALVPKLRDVPATSSLRLAAAGHLQSGGQLARAVRRAWWPVFVFAALGSRRARVALAVSVAVAPQQAPLDVAFGWGMWRSMWRHRTWAPIVPGVVWGVPGQRR